jgi:hypothetical protein
MAQNSIKRKDLSPMQITVTWQGIITAAGVVAAVLALAAYFARAVRWLDKQNEQDKEIKEIKEEQALLTHGILACLKGLKEQGCNGPVTDALNRLEKHLNKQAHK